MGSIFDMPHEAAARGKLVWLVKELMFASHLAFAELHGSGQASCFLPEYAKLERKVQRRQLLGQGVARAVVDEDDFNQLRREGL